MNEKEMAAFNEANKAVHLVETQWHHPILTKYGFVPITQEGVGFVRSYLYQHILKMKLMRLTTGVNADYWNEVQGGQNVAFGYHGTLEEHLKKITQEETIA
jgi:hypothetical protein